MPFLNFFGLQKIFAVPELAIDLGTANTRLYLRGRGLIVDEPSLIKLNHSATVVEAYGSVAARLAHLDPSFALLSPLHAGVVADIEAAASLLKSFLRRACKLRWRPQKALAFAPTDACEAEREALAEVARRAGMREVAIVPKPLAAAIGAGLDISSPYAQMVVELGEGVTDIAVIRAGKLIKTAALRTACSDLHRSVSQIVAARYGVLLPPHQAERLILELGVAGEEDEERLFITTGADMLTGRTVSFCLSNHDVFEAVESVTEAIIGAVQKVASTLPTDISCEIIESGICLTGGGALLKGLAERIEMATQFDVWIAPNPLHAVINGAREMLQISAQTGVWQHQRQVSFPA
jgi:rod shape-determining protein MreB